MALNWQWNEKIGECTLVQELHGEREEFPISIFKGNAFAIFIHQYEENGEKYWNMNNFFVDKEHAKRMFGIDKAYKETYGSNQMDIKGNWQYYCNFKFLKSSKDAKNIMKLMLDANWNHDVTFTLVDEL